MTQPWRTRLPGGLASRLGRAVARAVVDRVDRLGVFLLDDVALDLQRRGELAGWLGEVLGENLEALDLLHGSVARVDRVDRCLYLGVHQLGPIDLVKLLVVLARERWRLLGVERDQRHEIGAAVA